jgi:quercetin dioxygenase-like cupin family protein
MKRKLITAVSVSLFAVVGMTMTTVLPSGAQTEPPPIAVELLTPRGEFTDAVGLKVRYTLEDSRRRAVNLRDASRTVVARITVQPGARFPWHTHPGPVLVNVAQGELVYVRANDCVERPYPMGTAFVDPGKKTVHTAFNPTDGVTVVYATFYDVPETGPLTITEGVEEPDDCSIEVGPHSSH